MIGIYNAIGLQYRFAAAEVAAPADKAKAISLVLAGGIVGGFLGPEYALRPMDLFADAVPRLIRRACGVCARCARGAVARGCAEPPTLEERAGGGRPLAVILRQPVFIVAALAGTLGYGLMNLLMTATPLAMDFCAIRSPRRRW